MSDTKATIEAEKNFTSSLITALSILKTPPTRQEIKEKAVQLSMICAYSGDLEGPVKEALYSVDQKMGLGVSLVDVEAKHDDDWVYNKKNIEWLYAEAYEKFLKTEKWPPTVVRSLSDVGTKILGHLQDPTTEGSWDRRGLVIGHVQSGKTANYIGVLAKAADAGYKFIIVIAGIHNNLRKQTQERIDEGFVGRSSDPENRKIIGVGHPGYPHPATLTNIYNDFNKQTANQSGWRINDFSRPIVMVVKKNVSTLSSLYRWLKELNAQGNGKIADVPMLMIDDEADNASINTNKEDLDPTKTNRIIREILSLFEKSCYVGYTATPFANIFINPDAYDDDVREELFPRDFIYCLDAPNVYFGPDKVFLEEGSSQRILRVISDAEPYISLSHRKDTEVKELPESLYRAFLQFILVRAIRNLRGQKNKHCSMMINVSRFVSVQKQIKDIISDYKKRIFEAVKANYAMSESVSSKNAFMAKLFEVYSSEFSDCGHEWEEVKGALYEAVESIRIFAINNETDDALDYKKYEKDGTGLTAVAVGGLSLSRGLTIEGLCVSYMYRNTRMYDTLMQMGRWFGYRHGYEDLCRVYLSEDSIAWYSHIAESADELREQIKQMRRDRLSPKRFGLYVKSHPDSLMITASNKMRTGERISIKQNYSGRLIESHILPNDEGINYSNNELVKEYWKTGFGKGLEAVKRFSEEKGWFIEDAATDQLESFLLSFRMYDDFAEMRNSVVNYLKSISQTYPFSDVLLISIKENGENAGLYKLGSQFRKSAILKDNFWQLSKNRVASRGDEKFGLTEEQQKYAETIAKQEAIENNKVSDKPSDNHYRKVRKKPLLMIHVLDLVDRNSQNDQKNVPAFGISFPYGDYSEGVEVVANTIWIKQMAGYTGEESDYEEDSDE